MNNHVRKAMEKALIDVDGHLWGKTYVPDLFVEKFAEYLMQTKPLNDEEIKQLIDEKEPDVADMIRFARAIEERILGK